MYTTLTISQADPRPMYLQIKEQIRHRVAVGDWKPGQEIPSIRGLAVALQVSVITIKRAYLELEHEGIIITRQGKGSFVADSIELPTELTKRELTEHLEAAMRLAQLLGLTTEQLVEHLRNIDKTVASKVKR
jgi:GntR family transcriptional regulator